jgi:hypothetical protein
MLKKFKAILNSFKNQPRQVVEVAPAHQSLNIILCIPGLWIDRSEILVSIASANMHEYLYSGNILLHLPTNTHFEIEIHERDNRLKESFKVAGQGRIQETELSLIEQHTYIIYLIAKGGSPEHAEKIIHAGNAILNAGGLSIKIENSGKAFNATQWRNITDEKGEAKFIEAFVVFIIASDRSVYSCGMHTIGMRDILCDNDLNVDEATELIKLFLYFLLIDKPVIESGHTFRKQVDAPVFLIIEDICKTYPTDDLFFNPYGMYHLKSK